MLEIVILTDDISRSLFRYNGGPGRILSELPEKLARRVTDVLTKLSRNKITRIEYDPPHHLLLSNGEKWCRLSSARVSLEDNLILHFTETFRLFHWFLSPRFYSRDPQRLGAEIFCSECHSSQPRGVPLKNKCHSSFCPSHKKWAEVFEDYSPPPDLITKAFMGLPRTGDAANKWIAKG